MRVREGKIVATCDRTQIGSSRQSIDGGFGWSKFASVAEYFGSIGAVGASARPQPTTKRCFDVKEGFVNENATNLGPRTAERE